MAGRKGMIGDKPETDAGPEAGADEGGFLGRWSRRKAEANTAEKPAPAPSADLHDAEHPSDLAVRETNPATEEAGEAPAFDVSSLPDIDSLGPGSDFSMFMQTGVPAELKTKALRKLWRVKPELANLDGLLDYGEDLTGSFKVVDHLKTAYEVGRGFLRDQDDVAQTAGEETENVGEMAEPARLDPETSADQETVSDDVDAVDGEEPSTDKA